MRTRWRAVLITQEGVLQNLDWRTVLESNGRCYCRVACADL
jgi:hypothetical protein